MGQLAVPGVFSLVGFFLVIGLFFGLAELWAGRMRFVGLSQKEWREYAERYKRDNKPCRAIFGAGLAGFARADGQGSAACLETTRTG
nr:hypothetical protein [Klebsiella pneumoniae]